MGLRQEAPRGRGDGRHGGMDGIWRGLRGALVDNAKRDPQGTEERLSRPAPATWHERAADPTVRASVLTACRILEQQGFGPSFDQELTRLEPGHVISERDALSQAEAAHALALLWGHRGQIQADLRRAVFEGGGDPVSFTHP